MRVAFFVSSLVRESLLGFSWIDCFVTLLLPCVLLPSKFSVLLVNELVTGQLCERVRNEKAAGLARSCT